MEAAAPQIQIAIDRQLAKERAEDESRRADMKQHADKLIQGFEKLEESHAKRAIWELFQNAIDLSEKSEIVITLNENSLTFEHNGKPFTSNTLSCLIKQVSSKNAKNNEDEVGQYGTGFITTHSFGKRILITGSLKEGEYFIPLDEFEIDRIAQSADPELIDKLLIQQKRVFQLVETGELTTHCRPFTAFAYQTSSPLEKQNAERAIASLETILPYVMVINEKLQKVTVINKSGAETVYTKGKPDEENELTFTSVFINGRERKIYFLHSSAEEMTIILPLADRNKAVVLDDTLSKLFLFYPLIGTEQFGFNYIVHSRQFAPTEPRDGIHLKSKNEQVQEKETQNRALLAKALSLIGAFAEKHCEEIDNAQHLAYANFFSYSAGPYLSEYFKSIKDEWSQSFMNYKLVEGNSERQTPEQTLFLASDLLHDEEYLDAIYYVASTFWANMPKREIAKTWTGIVTDWQNDEIKFISIADVLTKIESADTLAAFSNASLLKRFYEYLIQHGHGDVFNQYRLLPNIKGEFRKRSQLSAALNIDGALIRIADIVIPDVPKRYIMENFQLDLSFEPYDRKQFSKDLNAQIAEHSKNIKADSVLSRDVLLGIVEYCKLFPSLDNTATRGLLTKLACEYYEVDATFRQLPTITNQELDWLPAMKCLLRNLIWDINGRGKLWVEKNGAFLESLISVVCDYYEFDDIIETLPLYPNQHFELRKRSELKLDVGIPDDLKDLYDNIVMPSELIRAKLFLDGFGKYAKAPEPKMPKALGEAIEEVFLKEMPLEVNEHPHKREIIGIIKRISDDKIWAEYFPKIDEKKATIMMARISDEETKNDLFSILGLEKEQIALLGELSRREDLEQIINKGKEALEEERQKNADFRFKHTIGTHIEKLVREKIGASLVNFKVDVREKQGGQDIIIEYNGEIVYYVEVKSRWDSKNSITVSAVQMKKAVENKENYALCCVDMVSYKKGDPDRYNVEDIAIILDHINVLIDIGGKFEPLLSGALAVKDIENEISLTGDYRGTVPQAVVQTGSRLEPFVDYLIGSLQLS